MIYSAIQNAVSAHRFDPSKIAAGSSTLPSINDWIRAKEAEVWQYADWPIKETAQLSLTVVGGTATIALPTGMTFTTQELHIFDDQGWELQYMAPWEFYDRFQPQAVGGATSTGTPTCWTLTTDVSSGSAAVPQVRVGPTPSGNKTYSVTGWSLPICRSAASTWKIGTMSSASDLPWWPDDYHFFLVSGAIGLGGMLLGDLDWQTPEQDFQNGLQRLAKELIPTQRDKLEQWGGVWQWP